MIIHLNINISELQLKNIVNEINKIGYSATIVKTQFRKILVCIGKQDFDIRHIGNIDGVEDIHIVNVDYKLVSRKWKVNDTSIELDKNTSINRDNLSIIAGPCSIESIENAEKTIQHLKKNNIDIMRVMVFKPRSSPYSFRGIGLEGLKEIHSMCKENDIKIISEVMQVSQVEEMCNYVDIFQVGTRNTQNFNLLDALGKVDKPVLIKRGMSGTLEELMQSAEYIFSNGNEKIILCERGIRTFEKSYRNTFDLNAIPILKEKTHLPVFADPSHAVGLRMYVPDMAYSAVIAGADGIMLEVHETPEFAISDSQQTLRFSEAELVYNNLKQVYKLKQSMKSIANSD